MPKRLHVVTCLAARVGEADYASSLGDAQGAPPDYLKEFGTPRSLDELSSHHAACSATRRTGQVTPWYVRVGQEVVHRPTAGALSTNDIDAELQAVLGGNVIGQVSSMYEAPLVRAGASCPYSPTM